MRSGGRTEQYLHIAHHAGAELFLLVHVLTGERYPQDAELCEVHRLAQQHQLRDLVEEVFQHISYVPHSRTHFAVSKQSFPDHSFILQGLIKKFFVHHSEVNPLYH